MARILQLKPAFAGMSTIVNVLERVGPGEANMPEDVKVVQDLLRMMCKGESPKFKAMGYPQVTGRFDSATGFWIYLFQDTTKRRSELHLGDTIVDGIVSPAHGSHYGPRGVWIIVFFNRWAQTNDPDNYAKFVASWSAPNAGTAHEAAHAIRGSR